MPRKPKKSNSSKQDFNQRAFDIVRQATEGSESDPPRSRESDVDYMKQIGSKGGIKGGESCPKSLTPDERAEIAHKAAEARWKKGGLEQPES